MLIPVYWVNKWEKRLGFDYITAFVVFIVYVVGDFKLKHFPTEDSFFARERGFAG